MHRLRNLLRSIAKPFLWAGYRWYLSKDRWYHYAGLRIRVKKSVFHPGLLFSSNILLRFALRQELTGRSLLELGAGSGMLALAAARAGAEVTATDINRAAVESILESIDANQLEMSVLESDVFDNIPATHFDYIFINPPYYARPAKNNREMAFFCGEDFDFFKKLFAQLPDYIHQRSKVFMILTDDCELSVISSLAKQQHFSMAVVEAQSKWGEQNLIFRIRRADESG